MNPMRKALALVLAPVGLTVAFAAPAQANSAAAQAVTHSQTAPIMHMAGADCMKGGIPGAGPTIGSVKFKETATTVSSTIVVGKGLKPSTVYNFTLIQTPSGEGCPGPIVVEATFKTNNKGGGYLRFSEPRLPGQTGAFVYMYTPAPGPDSAVSTGVSF